MGKAVPKGIKSKVNVILREMPEAEVSEDFEKNKTIINALKLPISKWTRNIMAGYMARSKKKAKLAAKREQELRAKKSARSFTPGMGMRREESA